MSVGGGAFQTLTATESRRGDGVARPPMPSRKRLTIAVTKCLAPTDQPGLKVDRQASLTAQFTSEWEVKEVGGDIHPPTPPSADRCTQMQSWRLQM